MSNIVRYKDSRINLDNVTSYKPIEYAAKPSIEFITITPFDTSNAENIQDIEVPNACWKFESEEKRDEALEFIDAQIDASIIPTSLH